MSDAVRPDTRGYHHSALVSSSDEEFVQAVGTFVDEGIHRGEHVVLALAQRQEELVGGSAARPGVSTLGPDHYTDPFSALSGYRTLVDEYLGSGARRVRIVGDIPRADPRIWLSWARYEASCNHFLSDLPVTALCTYDTRTASKEVLGDVRRLHPYLVLDGGRQVENSGYLAPEAFLEAWTKRTTDPLEERPADIVLTDPEPRVSRRAVSYLATLAGVPESGIVTAVSEVVANARGHGRPPVTLRGWTMEGRVVVTVTDAGSGPSDVFSGLLAPDLDGTHGRGLWMAHHLCDVAAISVADGQCTVRLVASAATPAERRSF